MCKIKGPILLHFFLGEVQLYAEQGRRIGNSEIKAVEALTGPPMPGPYCFSFSQSTHLEASSPVPFFPIRFPLSLLEQVFITSYPLIRSPGMILASLFYLFFGYASCGKEFLTIGRLGIAPKLFPDKARPLERTGRKATT